MGRAEATADSPDVRRISIDFSPFSAESSFRELDDVFLQTQTRIWLGEVLHTRFDEETAIADLLADGKLLFQVSKVVWKMLLTKCAKLRYSKAYFHESVAPGKSSGRYMPYSNVDSFLKICQILGLTGIDLFSPSDVVEKRDIRRVCMCIRSFSKKARSKDLNVPDFDVVTYTVAMPTDMVECIRRSLERPQCIFSSSDSFGPYLDSKQKYRQKNWGADHTRQYDSYSEESDDAESNYRVFGFHSPASISSHDDSSLLISDIENSPEESSAVVESLVSRASIFGSRRYISCQFGTSDLSGQGTDSGDSVLFNGKGNLHTETSFHRSNSIHRTSRCGLRRNLSEEIEAAEISPTTSMNYISGKVETLDYEDQFEVEDDFSSPNIQVPQLQNLGTHYKDCSSTCGYESQEMFEHDIIMDSSTRDTVTSQFDLKFEDIGSSIKPLETAECQPDSEGLQNDILPESLDINIPCVDLYVAKYNTVGLPTNCNDQLNSENLFRNKYWSQHNGNLPGESGCFSSIKALWNENHKCSMDTISNGSNCRGASSKLVTSHSMSPNNVSHCSIKVSGDGQGPNDSSTVITGDMEEFGVTPNQSDNVMKENLNCSSPSADCFSNNVEISCVGFDVVPSMLAITNSEKCSNSTMLGGSDMKQYDSLGISYCNGGEIHHAKSDFETRNEGEMNVLVGRKQLFAEDSSNGFIKKCYGESIKSKSTSKESIFLNSFSSVLTGVNSEEVQCITSVSAEPSCVPEVSSSGIKGPEKQSLSNVKSVSMDRPIISSAKNLDQDPVMHQAGPDISEDKLVPPINGNVLTAESGSPAPNLIGQSESHKLEIGEMLFSLDFSSDLECSHVINHDTQTLNMVSLDDLVVHCNGGAPVCCVSGPGNMPCKTSACSQNVAIEDQSNWPLVDENDLQVVHQACTNQEKDASCLENMVKDEENHENMDRDIEASKCRSGKRVLLKSVAGGISLFGVFFLLFNLRKKSGKEKNDESRMLSVQIRKTSHGEVSTLKRQQKGRVDGVYPGEKLRFQD